MARHVRNSVALALLGAVLAAAGGCGSEETIRVDLLPPGNARGSAASGLYAWSETVSSSSCTATVSVGGVTVSLPQRLNEWSACVDVVHDEGYYAADFFGFGGGPAGVVRPGYNADGGLWQEGQYRIGGLFNFGTGVTARALIDGQYPRGTEVVSFEGVGLVQVFATEGGRERYLCQYNITFTGDRAPGCGE
jgi:hypothetical protein